jgi:GTP-dependent phosphoenolpyruvate carboxykinase
MRRLPMFPGQWVFGRRAIKGEPLYFAVRGHDTPVLVVAARDWRFNGVVVSTPYAAEIAAALSTLGDTEEEACLAS